MRWLALLLVGAGIALAFAVNELVMAPAGSPPDDSAPAAAAAARGVPESERAEPKPRRENEEPSLGSNVYYQYVDGASQVQFARSLEEIPEEWRDRAGRVALPVPPPASPAPKRAAGRRAPSPAARHAEGTFSPARSEEQRGAQPDIEIYTLKSCSYCRAAMAYMDKRGLDYTNRDIEEEPEAREEYLEKTDGRAGVPVIDVAGEVMQGWNPKHFEAVLASMRQ